MKLVAKSIHMYDRLYVLSMLNCNTDDPENQYHFKDS
jgi:hypothetical protein